jgi:hypothetical protein
LEIAAAGAEISPGEENDERNYSGRNSKDVPVRNNDPGGANRPQAHNPSLIFGIVIT